MGRPEPAPLAEPWASMPGAESTSARLRRVTAERDEARAELATERRLLAEAHETIRALLGARTEPATEGAPPE